MTARFWFAYHLARKAGRSWRSALRFAWGMR
jgi:hypothetical protein